MSRIASNPIWPPPVTVVPSEKPSLLSRKLAWLRQVRWAYFTERAELAAHLRLMQALCTQLLTERDEARRRADRYRAAYVRLQEKYVPTNKA